MTFRLNQGLFFAALGLADAAVWMAAQGEGWPDPALILFYALAFSQMSLAAIWGGLGTTRLALRCAAVLLAIAGFTLLLETMHSNGYFWAWLLAIQALVVGGPLLILQGLGIRLARDQALLQAEQSPDSRPLQFSLRHVLLWTTGAAIVLAIARHVELPTRGRGMWQEGAYLATGFATVALVAVWAGLGLGHTLIKLPVLLVISAGTGYVLAAVTAGPPNNWMAVSALSSEQAVLLAAYLWAFRQNGYRLQRRLRSRPLAGP